MPFDIPRSGLTTAIGKLRATANNIANVATSGFKQSRVESVDTGSPINGGGVRVASITPSLSQGAPEFTDYQFDFAISGQGYFSLNDNGAKTYSRAGSFRLDRNGNVVNGQNQKLTGFMADKDGNITSQTGDLQFNLNTGAPRATSQFDIRANLDASAALPSAAFNPGDPSSYNFKVSAPAIDSVGASHIVDVYFTKTATPGTWDMRVYSEGAAVAAPATRTFDTSGAMTSPASGTVMAGPFDPGNGAANLSLNLNIGQITQYNTPSHVSEISQDGVTSSALVGVAVNSNGILSARYSDGNTATIGQVALAQFSDPQGLSSAGNGLLSMTVESGAAQIGAPGANGMGLIQAGALETSNVNLDEQLLSLKQAMYEFAANTKVIKTTNEMLGSLFKDKA